MPPNFCTIHPLPPEFLNNGRDIVGFGVILRAHSEKAVRSKGVSLAEVGERGEGREQSTAEEGRRMEEGRKWRATTETVVGREVSGSLENE